VLLLWKLARERGLDVSRDEVAEQLAGGGVAQGGQTAGARLQAAGRQQPRRSVG
jgi:hypothetical protein